MAFAKNVGDVPFAASIYIYIYIYLFIFIFIFPTLGVGLLDFKLNSSPPRCGVVRF